MATVDRQTIKVESEEIAEIQIDVIIESEVNKLLEQIQEVENG